MSHNLAWPVSLGRTVHKNLHKEIDSVWVGIVEYLLESDLRSRRVDLVGVHWAVILRIRRIYELLARRAQQLGDLSQLEHRFLALEDGFSHVHLSHNAAESPYVDLGSVDAAPNDQLRGSIVPRADVRNRGLVRFQHFSGAKIADFQQKGLWVDEDVRRFNVSVADLKRVQVVHGSCYLERVDLDVALREVRLVHVVALDLGL